MPTNPEAARRRARYDKAHAILERADRALVAADADLNLGERKFRLGLLRLLIVAARRSNIPDRARARMAKAWRDAWKPKRT